MKSRAPTFLCSTRTARVALLEFERRGKEALASLVLVDGSRTMFVCALQRGSWYAPGTAWQTAEGRLLSLWISDGSDRFTKVINDYWYQAPR